MITIRKIMEEYKKVQAAALECSIEEAINKESTCFHLRLNNGAILFFDIIPEVLANNDEWKSELPKKNIFRKMSFDIIVSDMTDVSNNVSELDITSVLKYCDKKITSELVWYHCEAVKEKYVNQLISDNGGVDIDYFKNKTLWQLKGFIADHNGIIPDILSDVE